MRILTILIKARKSSNITIIVEDEAKSISLSPQLTPTVSFKLMKNSYLGTPYTTCKRTMVNDTYYINDHNVYKRKICEMEFFLKLIYDSCGCCPTYMINQHFKYLNFSQKDGWFFLLRSITRTLSTKDIRPCNFYDNVKCVAAVVDKKGSKADGNRCEPACQSFEFNQDSIHVSNNFRTRDII